MLLCRCDLTAVFDRFGCVVTRMRREWRVDGGNDHETEVDIKLDVQRHPKDK